MKILILNGPNINMLGLREPEIYGKETYEDLKRIVTEYAVSKNVDVKFYQSNHEGDLVDAIQRAYFEKTDGIVFNPAAYTHTSVAILDALKSVNIPTVEVHISDISKREEFRQKSYIRDYSLCTITGKGLLGYTLAIDELLRGSKNESDN